MPPSLQASEDSYTHGGSSEAEGNVRWSASWSVSVAALSVPPPEAAVKFSVAVRGLQ